MNGNDRKDLSLVLDVLREHQKEREILADDVKEIKICLVGDPSKHNDLGLQGAVERNTAFRHTATKGMWVMATGFIGTMVIAIKSYFK